MRSGQIENALFEIFVEYIQQICERIIKTLQDLFQIFVIFGF